MEESRRKAEQEPITLKKNWVAAVLIILFWAVIFTAVGLAITGYLKTKSG